MSQCCNSKNEPVYLNFTLKDYIKAFICWLRSFKITYKIEPGLYYTGKSYDMNAPLLVTSNYLLTVFLLWRVLRQRNIRLLVIDTKGVNVWCSSGKEQFNAEEIKKQLDRYDSEILGQNDKLKLILPKLSLSGVNLKKLRKYQIVPVIGPIYRQNIPTYLDECLYKNCNDEKYHFNLRDRLFTLLPSLTQFSKYLLFYMLGLFIWDYFKPTGIYWQVLAIGFVVGLLYIILFPFLFTKNFAIKGFVLGLFLNIPFWLNYSCFSVSQILFYTLFI